MLPGLPKLPFFFLAIMLLVAWSRATDAPLVEEDVAPAAAVNEDEVGLDLQVEALELDLSLDLLDLVDPAYGATLLDRVPRRCARWRWSSASSCRSCALVTTCVLTPTCYSIRANGIETGRGEAPVGQVMVLAGDGEQSIVGKPTTEPVFGLPAYWVPDAMADHYRSRGDVTVVDRSSVIVTHLAEIVRRNAASLLSRGQDVHRMVEAVRTVAPVVADAIGPNGVPLVDVHDFAALAPRRGRADP